MISMRSDDDGEQVVGLFAKLHPEDAVEIGVLDVRVVGQRLRKRGLAIAARAAQRRRDGDRVALGVEQLVLQRLELRRALHEIRRRLRRHHRHALLRARPFQHPHQRLAMLLRSRS